MFFSVNHLYAALCDPANLAAGTGDYARTNSLCIPGTTQPCKKRVRAHVRSLKAAIVNRQTAVRWAAKWLRPWDVVPALRNYQAPDGQFAVGVEVEMGFNDRNAVRAVASHIQHWKHITLDNEGGNYPLEVTFPPVVYSKFGRRCQVANYLRYLNSTDHVNRAELEQSAYIGTHVNISKGGNTIPVATMQSRCATMNTVLPNSTHSLGGEIKRRYFGRDIPYGYSVWQGHYVEFKMFKSSTDFTAMKRYVNIAVALADLLYSDRRINNDSIREALELGYNKRV